MLVNAWALLISTSWTNAGQTAPQIPFTGFSYDFWIAFDVNSRTSFRVTPAGKIRLQCRMDWQGRRGGTYVATLSNIELAKIERLLRATRILDKKPPAPTFMKWEAWSNVTVLANGKKRSRTVEWDKPLIVELFGLERSIPWRKVASAKDWIDPKEIAKLLASQSPNLPPHSKQPKVKKAN